MILTLAVGALGGYILYRLKVPGGLSMGALIAVGVFSLLTGWARSIPNIKVIMQVSSGMIIGSRITKATVKHLKNIWKIYLVTMALFILQTILMAFLMYACTDYDIITCFFSLSPGGQTDMTILSADYGAQSAIVAMMHSFRMILIYLIIPFVVRKVAETDGDEAYIGQEKSDVKPNVKDWIFVLIFALVLGYLFKLIDLSGATMFGSIIGGALYSIFIREYRMPKILSSVNMVLSGTYSGTLITVSMLHAMTELWIGLLFITGFLLICLVVDSLILRMIFRIQRLTSMFICSPGGLSEICLLAEELGGDIPTVATLQTARLLTVVFTISSLAPVMQLIASWIR